ncbi:MAG: hypothetical protein PHW52_00335 [Candidatus Pacebacteria bacterium]|nr:hypothetical protein [Candidatus Paceibacterota bacterium]
MTKRSNNTQDKKELKKEIIWNDVLNIFILYIKDSSDENKKLFLEKFNEYLNQEVKKQAKSNEYNILVLFDNASLSNTHSDKIYRSLNKLDRTKPLILVIHSGGGYPGPAYLIGKLCKQFSDKKFIAVVPRYAKSAATLLSCGADEIHMGKLSELGPIDPQINNMPTLGLKNSVEHIAELVGNNPKSSEMFARYLALTIEPISIGHYERVAESAAQYAIRLLEKKKDLLIKDPGEIATRLVYGYKDHSFVIDQEEAETIFGDKVLKKDTDEYKIGDCIYSLLSRIENLTNLIDYKFSFIGELMIDSIFLEKKPKR